MMIDFEILFTFYYLAVTSNKWMKLLLVVELDEHIEKKYGDVPQNWDLMINTQYISIC